MIGINEMIEYLFVIYMHDMQYNLKVKYYFFYRRVIYVCKSYDKG